MRKQKWALRFSATVAILMLSALLATTGRAAPGLAYTYEFIPGASYTQDDVKALLRVATADVYALPLTDVEWRDPQGNIAQCRPSSGGCAIRNQYSNNGSLIASTHEFYIAGEHRMPGVYLNRQVLLPRPLHPPLRWRVAGDVPRKFHYQQRAGRASNPSASAHQCHFILYNDPPPLTSH